jgi:hypothetical protein
VPDAQVTSSAFRQEVSMPWKDCSMMEERLRLVSGLLEGESILGGQSENRGSSNR